MTELKTKPNQRSAVAFLAGIRSPERRRDIRSVAAMTRAETGCRPRMWAPPIVGYGRYRYHRANEKEAEWFLTGFYPRVGALTLYIMTGVPRHCARVQKLCKHSTGRACLHVKQLSGVHAPTLRRLVRESVRALKVREART